MNLHDSMRREAILGAVICWSLSGCSGNDWHAETYPVAGTVMINGEPATDAVVELHSVSKKPDSRNSRPWGLVQADGSYTLTTYAKADGAPPGEYALTLRWPTDITTPSQVDRLSGAYAKVEKAPLKVTVEAKELNELPPVTLTGVKVLTVEKATRPRSKMKGPGPVMAK